MRVLEFTRGEQSRRETGLALQRPLDALDLDQVDADGHGAKVDDRAVSTKAWAILTAVRVMVQTAAASAFLFLAVVVPVQAGVRVSTERIVVTASGARATIDRSPLRLSFADGSGKRVLTQVPNARPGPFVIPPSVEPEALGADIVDGPSLYSPLTFTVGARVGLEYPASLWVGNKLLGAEVGTQYSATDVTGVRRAGAGVVLTVATNDPSGRVLTVRVTPAGSGALRVAAQPASATGVVAMSDSFTSAPGEAFHGFGGRHNAIDQRGEDFYNWVEQQNTGAGIAQPVADLLPGTGGKTYLFPNGPTGAFYVQSQFISSHGYGFLLDSDRLSGWRMASDRPDAWQVTADGAALDYIVAPGAGPRAIATTTRLGGRHRVPPRWALGPHLDRLTRFTGETVESYTASVEDDLRQIKRYDLPITSYRIEAWAWLERDYLRSVIRRLHRMGIRALVYFRAFVGRDEIGTDRPSDYDRAVDNGWVATNADGDPYTYIGNFQNLTAQIDFTDPEAVEWWSGRVSDVLRLGADGFMQDFGEQVLSDMHFDNGETGATMHNRFPVLFHKITREVVDRFERNHPGRRIWFFTRSGYSGTPGSAAYEGGNFPGDENTDWSPSSGLRSQAPDMLNRAVGGAYGFGTDIGGYVDLVTPPTTKELFIRWAQWAALSPVMRLHGSIVAGTHTPWSYDAETVRIYKRLSRLHLRAAPLIMRLWREAAATGVPPTRPLWLAHPNDPDAANQDQQWLLGPDVLVAPVVREGATTRDVYFPRGCWRDPHTGRSYRGPLHATVEAPLTKLPYFTRCGTQPLS